MAHNCLVNARFRKQRVTGVQRYAIEICKRLNQNLIEITPSRLVSGIQGHLWEQCVLPFNVSGGLLWSPCNTGPLAVRNQVVTIHDMAVFDHPEWFSTDFVLLYNALLPCLARSVRKIVTVSDFSKERICKCLNISEQKVVVIPNGVSELFTKKNKTEVIKVKKKYNINSDSYFVVLGTLEPRKNVLLAFRGWLKFIKKTKKYATLVVIGGGGGAAFSKAIDFPNSDNIVYTGYVGDNDLPAILTGAISLIYPSLYEGFGLPILEAMACGTPVITTKQTSMPFVAEDAALYIEPDNVEMLSDTMEKLFLDASLQDKLSKTGLLQSKKFSWDKSAAIFSNLLATM